MKVVSVRCDGMDVRTVRTCEDQHKNYVSSIGKRWR